MSGLGLGLNLGLPKGFGSGGFSPLMLPSLGMWYDLQNFSYSDTGLTTLATDGQTVGSVRDLSGNGRHLVQATAGLRPTYTVAGLPAVAVGAGSNILGAPFFDGTDDQLGITGGSYNYPANMTVYVVAYSTGAAGESRCLFGAGFDGAPSGNGFRLMHDSTQMVLKAYSGSALISDTQAGEVLNAWYRTYGVKDNSAPGLLVTINETGSINSLVTPIAVAAQPLFVGARAAATSPFKGYVVEVIAYEAVHTVQQRSDVTAYLKGKWGFS